MPLIFGVILTEKHELYRIEYSDDATSATPFKFRKLAENVADFAVDSRGRILTVLSNGYPWVSCEYIGGHVGRIRALSALQRSIRPYRPGRDGRILSNNWGAGYSDSRLDESYALREIAAGALLGVEVVELDDGWQKGRSVNSTLLEGKRGKGVWNGYWSYDPEFWKADPVRFPRGLTSLVSRAKEFGMDFGLWFGPDSSNEAQNWERDADLLLSFYREFGIRYFKVDSMKSLSPIALKRQRALFDKVLGQSSSNVVFDLDVTAEVRPGYWGLPDVGTLFVENRYAKHCSWWPHLSLRNLWTLCWVIDPLRLRMEFLDPKQHSDLYAARFPQSPLRPELWTGDAVFATVMLSSPLAWMEMQGLQEDTLAEMRPIISRWKKERDSLYDGVVFPVGSKPDGFSWTGFIVESRCDSVGYALIFRECSSDQSFKIDLAQYRLTGDIEVLAGDGSAKIAQGGLEVSIPKRLGYVWLAFRPHKKMK